MAKIPEGVKYADFMGGQANNINVTLAPKNTVELGLNFDFDYEIGAATTRLGLTQIDSQLVNDKSILGLFQHVDQGDTTKNKLFASINDATNTNSDIWDLDGTPAISLADDTQGLKTYWLNYAGDTVRLNGTDAPGGVFDLANMPTAYKYPKEFLDRVYLWGNSSAPYTLAYSGILTAGTVSWTSGNGTVQIEPEDGGGEGTGLGKVPGYILIFKRRSMKRWNYSSAFPESLVNIGAYSQESIVEGGGLCAFYSDSNEDAKGFYVTNGGRPQCISKDNNRPITKWVNAIGATANVAGYATDRVFGWSVGDLTVDGESFTNVVLRYNRILNQWSVRSYPTELKVFALYVASKVGQIIVGDDDGNVWEYDKTGKYQDGSTDILYRLRTQHDTFSYNQIKSMTDRVIVRGKNLAGAVVSIIKNEDIDTTDPVGGGALSIWNKILGWIGVSKKIEATTMSVEIKGTGMNSDRVHVREIELPGIEVLQNYNG